MKKQVVNGSLGEIGTSKALRTVSEKGGVPFTTVLLSVMLIVAIPLKLLVDKFSKKEKEQDRRVWY